jgi:hypothetical protein
MSAACLLPATFIAIAAGFQHTASAASSLLLAFNPQGSFFGRLATPCRTAGRVVPSVVWRNGPTRRHARGGASRMRDRAWPSMAGSSIREAWQDPASHLGTGHGWQDPRHSESIASRGSAATPARRCAARAIRLGAAPEILLLRSLEFGQEERVGARPDPERRHREEQGSPRASPALHRLNLSRVGGKRYDAEEGPASLVATH